MMEIVGCDNLQQYVADFSLVSDCSIVKNGAVRFATPFTYPDGSHIDLFLKSKDDLFDQFVLSDYGQTYEYLFAMGFNIWGTAKRQQFVQDICTGLGVLYKQNAFEISFAQADIKHLPSFITRLTQACLRITDLSFTQRILTYDSFEDEVEEVIALTEVPYKTDVAFTGRWANEPVKVNFLVEGKNTSSLVRTLSAKSSYPSHNMALEIYVGWESLEAYRSQFQFVTVYDDRTAMPKDSDFARLFEISTTLAFPSQNDEFRTEILR